MAVLVDDRVLAFFYFSDDIQILRQKFDQKRFLKMVKAGRVNMYQNRTVNSPKRTVGCGNLVQNID
jgi:hypothetical protein